MDLFSRMVATEIEVDKLGVYFGGRISRTGLAVGHKGKDDIKNDPEILVCHLCGWYCYLFAKTGVAEGGVGWMEGEWWE